MYYLLGVVIVLVLIALSCRWNWWRKNEQGIAILMYHKIGIASRGTSLKKLWINPEKFDKQMAYLSRHKYNVITLKELFDNLLDKKSVPEKTVVITFDDGYKNNYSKAFPILKKYNLKATIFLNVAYVGGKSEWEDSRAEPPQSILSWDEILEMLEYGIDFGSHTLTHANLLYCKDEPKRLDHEINQSKKILEDKLHWPVVSFAYPYGEGTNDKKIKEALKKAGYKIACGIKQGKVSVPVKDMFNLKRLLIRGDENIVDFAFNIKKGRTRL